MKDIYCKTDECREMVESFFNEDKSLIPLYFAVQEEMIFFDTSAILS